MAILTYNV